MLRRGSCVYLHVHRFYLVGLSGYVFHVMIMGFTSGFLGVSQWEAQRQLVCDVCVRTISCFVCTFLQSVCSCPSCTLAYFQSFFCKGVVFLSQLMRWILFVSQVVSVRVCLWRKCSCSFYSPPLFSPMLRALVSSEGPCKCLCMCAKFL